jgi:hypothetical protein
LKESTLGKVRCPIDANAVMLSFRCDHERESLFKGIERLLCSEGVEFKISMNWRDGVRSWVFDDSCKGVCVDGLLEDVVDISPGV